MNEKVLTMVCLKGMLNFQYLLFWQKHYLKQKIKIKLMKFKKMSEDETNIEKPDKILSIVKEISNFNKKIQEKGLKILMPDQMPS